MSKKNTVFLVGADTGGHVVPVYALALELEKDPNTRVFVLGVGTEIEKKFYPKLQSSIFIKIIAGKSQFGSIIGSLISYVKLAIGFIQAKYLLIKFRPKVIFLKGNYATLPIAYAARLLRFPIINHESDSIVGRSNKIIANFSESFFVSYPIDFYQESLKNPIYSGPILRDKFLDPQNTTDKDFLTFGFDKNIPILLILGGSLGASSINDAIFASLDKILDKFQVIHQTGAQGNKEAQKVKSKLSIEKQKRYYQSSFIDREIFSAINIADVIISRSGSSIFEFAAFKKTAILIPYPYASFDHQRRNAEYFLSKDAAIVIDDKKLEPESLLKQIIDLSKDEKKRKQLADNFYHSVNLQGKAIVLSEIKKYLK